MKRAIVALMAVVVILIGAVFYFTKQAQDKANKVVEPITSQKSSSSIENNKNNNSSNKSTHNRAISKDNKSKEVFSNDEWMLMGYMAYARKNHNNEATAKLIEDIAQELSDDVLNIVKNSDNTYTLSNKYGSVNVEVGINQVKVTNDGITINSKIELKKTFGLYKNKLARMTAAIKSKEE
ncbi:uncharacterized protein YxeA [Lactobacillus colini]|uniref:Uncharacterized protein YxeA n=1 Tax=Lactobacillus colini TaxID=1819254 RepID=A0ABS4MDM6_9LACO|nr:hypothetical protein [Lactobacillus colini]MBP2057764.1 uncharacterized protein YxeA [Lactobacillus colini]